MVLSIIGIALTLPPLGVINYAFPAIGRAYLAGDSSIFAFVNDFFRFPMVAVLFPAVLFVPLGTILFSIGIWKSGVLPRWSGVLLAVPVLLLAFPLPIHILRLIGGVLQVVAGWWIVSSAMRQPGIQVEAKAHL
jgi:hypothetical protein